MAALLGGCAPAALPGGPILAGRVDPETVASATVATASGECTLRLRASLPVSVVGLPLVPARINGQAATLILDTGAESTLLTEAAAKRLGVSSRYDFMRSISGIGGSVATGDAALASMSLGGIALSYPRALVGRVAFRLGPIDADGLLGASLLGDFDLDLDIPHRRVDLYDRMDCATVRPAWRGRYVALQTTRSLSAHPFFPISVNGRTISASLDTGAQRTVIAARAAAALGIGAQGQLVGQQTTIGAAGESMPATLHLLRDVRVGGVPLRGPVIVAPATLPRDIDALLGFDFLLGHRVWLSYGSRRIFISAE